MAQRRRADQPTAWRNRIIGEAEVSPVSLMPNPRNWRRHPLTQQRALAGVLGEIGWVQRIIVNERTGHVVDGHARLALAVEREEQTVPVLYVDLSEEEEKLVLATFDPVGQAAVADREMLADLVADLKVQDEALVRLLVDAAVVPEAALNRQRNRLPDDEDGEAAAREHQSKAAAATDGDADRVMRLIDGILTRRRSRVVELRCGSGLLLEARAVPPDRYIGIESDRSEVAAFLSAHDEHICMTGDATTYDPPTAAQPDLVVCLHGRMSLEPAATYTRAASLGRHYVLTFDADVERGEAPRCDWRAALATFQSLHRVGRLLVATNLPADALHV